MNEVLEISDLIRLYEAELDARSRLCAPASEGRRFAKAASSALARVRWNYMANVAEAAAGTAEDQGGEA